MIYINQIAPGFYFFDMIIRKFKIANMTHIRGSNCITLEQ